MTACQTLLSMGPGPFSSSSSSGSTGAACQPPITEQEQPLPQRQAEARLDCHCQQLLSIGAKAKVLRLALPPAKAPIHILLTGHSASWARHIHVLLTGHRTSWARRGSQPLRCPAGYYPWRWSRAVQGPSRQSLQVAMASQPVTAAG